MEKKRRQLFPGSQSIQQPYSMWDLSYASHALHNLSSVRPAIPGSKADLDNLALFIPGRNHFTYYPESPWAATFFPLRHDYSGSDL